MPNRFRQTAKQRMRAGSVRQVYGNAILFRFLRRNAMVPVTEREQQPVDASELVDGRRAGGRLVPQATKRMTANC
jgi:hypothetical protein